MERKSSHAAAVNKYNRNNTVQLLIRLNKNTDTDIIAALSSAESKQGYIKALIRADIKKRKQ